MRTILATILTAALLTVAAPAVAGGTDGIRQPAKCSTAKPCLPLCEWAKDCNQPAPPDGAHIRRNR